jgi:selenophosphate synthase
MELQLKRMLMSTVDKRAALHHLIEGANEVFIEAAYLILTGQQAQSPDPIIGYSVEGKPMHASVAKQEYKRRVEAVDQGAFITLEELKKESKTWLQGTADTK